MNKFENSRADLHEMFEVWLKTDMVKAGSNYRVIEKGNEAFVRGYRHAMHQVLLKFEAEKYD